MEQSVSFDLDLIRRYDQSGPRYTSYPTAVEFTESFDETAYREACTRSNQSRRPLSLYLHLPFCDTVCFYCACNKVATKDRALVAPYLERMIRELALQSNLFDKNRIVEQLHWGGGTPTFLSQAQMTELMQAIRKYFTFTNDEGGEFSIEIDPREADASTVHLLRQLGFNRMSLGVQDFDPQVQAAVNRFQTEAQTLTVLEAALAEGFRSISLDLIYGLPLQSVASFSKTIERVIAIGPQRLSIFNYAHLPERFKPQRRLNPNDLPAPQVKLDILQTTIQQLTAAGYIYIGMDHFARPDDELTLAQQAGTLYRNFQGYSTHANCDLIGIGVTSIGKVDNTYAQNQRELADYDSNLDAGKLAIFRGITLNRDDQIRRDAITKLICHFQLDINKFESTWDINFADYFYSTLQQLNKMAADGLLELTAERIRILPRGRLLVRNICMTFDAYLAAKTGPIGFSKVI